MQKGDWIGLGMTGVAIAIFGALLWSAPEAPEVDFGPVDVGGGAVSIPAQTLAGAVTFSAELAKPGFVSIHESVGPAPGEVIGVSSLLPEGATTDATISLSTEMIPGLTYIALLHVDNGDGMYRTDDDMPVKTDGSVVRVDFKLAE